MGLVLVTVVVPVEFFCACEFEHGGAYLDDHDRDRQSPSHPVQQLVLVGHLLQGVE